MQAGLGLYRELHGEGSYVAWELTNARPTEFASKAIRVRCNTMRKVEVHGGGMFHCPKCEQPNRFRNIDIDNAGDVPVPGTGGFYGGKTDWPAGWNICRCCRYALTKQQQKTARPMDIKGGCVLPAWWFTCDICGLDVFVDVTIYHGSGSEGSPSMLRCSHCEEPFERDIPDEDCCEDD